MTHQSMRSILAFGACISLPAMAQDGTREPLKEKPNIVLIYADDIGSRTRYEHRKRNFAHRVYERWKIGSVGRRKHSRQHHATCQKIY